MWLFKKTIYPFFCKNGKVKPIRVFITCIVGLTIWAIYKEIQTPGSLSPSFIGVLYGGLGMLLGADVWKKRRNKKRDNGE